MLRTLVVANGTVLVALGFLALAYVDHPPGALVAAALWVAAAVVFGLLPLTDPYRHERQH